jgi:hypothetical protein
MGCGGGWGGRLSELGYVMCVSYAVRCGAVRETADGVTVLFGDGVWERDPGFGLGRGMSASSFCFGMGRKGEEGLMVFCV